MPAEAAAPAADAPILLATPVTICKSPPEPLGVGPNWAVTAPLLRASKSVADPLVVSTVLTGSAPIKLPKTLLLSSREVMEALTVAPAACAEMELATPSEMTMLGPPPETELKVAVTGLLALLVASIA